MSERTSLSLKYLNRILIGDRGISLDTAISLSRVLGHSPKYWMDLAIEYKLYHLREKFEKEVEENREWFESFPLQEMISLGLIEEQEDFTDTCEQLLKLFRVEDVECFHRYYTKKYKEILPKESQVRIEDYALHMNAVKVLGERLVYPLLTPDYKKPPVFSKERLKNSYADSGTFVKLRPLLRDAGVIVVDLPESITCPDIASVVMWDSREKATPIVSVNTSMSFELQEYAYRILALQILSEKGERINIRSYDQYQDTDRRLIN